ncbi:MAG: hypothetical protein JJ958_12990 [Balneola sp.]|nr:hypothetical protein [Balneola sp.]
MKVAELFDGVLKNKLPRLDIIDAIEELGSKENGVTRALLVNLATDFSWYLQDYVNKILEKRKSDTSLIELYENEEDENYRIYYVIQTYYQDADLSEYQMHSIFKFIDLIISYIERIDYLKSDKVTVGESVESSFKEGISNLFFNDVHSGGMSDLEIYTRVQELTDNFDSKKIDLLCNDYDYYFFWKMEFWEGDFTPEEIENKIEEYEKAGKEIPMMGGGNQGGMGVSDYFKPERIIQKTEPLTKEQRKQRLDFKKKMDERIKKTVNIGKLMDPYGFEFYSLYRLRNLLIQLKVEHTSAELRPEFHSKFDNSTSKQKSLENYIKPIHWLKGKENLKHFLDIIKREGLIEKKNTEEIIQEHFFVDGQAPIKEPHSIKWLIESKYLAYLMHSLAEEFIINIKGKKHELTASHFISSKGEPLKPKSLASQLSQIQKEKSNKTIHTILSIISKLKS